MNSKTSSLLNSYAKLSGHENDARRIKSAWDRLSSKERGVLRARIEKDVEALKFAEKVKSDIEKNRSVRKLTQGDARVLWFMSDKLPDEAVIYVSRLNRIEKYETSNRLDDRTVEFTDETFDRFWAFAVPDPIPACHLEPLNLPTSPTESVAIRVES